MYKYTDIDKRKKWKIEKGEKERKKEEIKLNKLKSEKIESLHRCITPIEELEINKPIEEDKSSESNKPIIQNQDDYDVEVIDLSKMKKAIKK
jgi:hypothetical protein